jgi:thioredoxin reductase
MLLHRLPTKNRGQSLIDQLGLETKPTGEVVTDLVMLRTNIRGYFAMGDMQELMKQAMIAGSIDKPFCMDSGRLSLSLF